MRSTKERLTHARHIYGCYADAVIGYAQHCVLSLAIQIYILIIIIRAVISSSGIRNEEWRLAITQSSSASRSSS